MNRPPAGHEPFTRSDHAANSRYETAKLALGLFTLAPLRVFLWLLLVFPIYPLCRALHLLAPLASRPAVAWLARWMARLTLVCLGFWPSCISICGRAVSQPAVWLVFANHISWLDILFFMSEPYSPAFVAKSGYLRAPVVGWFATVVFECIQVGPGSTATAALSARLLATASSPRPRPFVIFPEGTTTNGQRLLQYRTGGFVAAVQAANMLRPEQKRSAGRATVLLRPCVLRYPHRRFSPAWESVSVATHAARLLTQLSNRLEVWYCPAVRVDCGPVHAEHVKVNADRIGGAVRRAMAEQMAATSAAANMTRDGVGLLPQWRPQWSDNCWDPARYSIATKERYHDWLRLRLEKELAWPGGRLLYMHPPDNG